MRQRAKQLFTAIGTALTVIGLIFAFQPAIPPGIPAGGIFFTLLGAVAGVLTVNSVNVRRHTQQVQTRTGDVEIRGTFPQPGVEANVELDIPVAVPPRNLSGRNVVETRIREAAIDVLVRRENCTPSEAEDMLNAGIWTDDPYAAGYFTGNLPEEPVLERIKRRVGLSATPVSRPARHAIAELARLDPSVGDPDFTIDEEADAEDEAGDEGSDEEAEPEIETEPSAGSGSGATPPGSGQPAADGGEPQ
ncbi:MAG: hypothetical protein ABEJ08_02835 [Halobacteriaceae archaeon]